MSTTDNSTVSATTTIMDTFQTEMAADEFSSQTPRLCLGWVWVAREQSTPDDVTMRKRMLTMMTMLILLLRMMLLMMIKIMAVSEDAYLQID